MPNPRETRIMQRAEQRPGSQPAKGTVFVEQLMQDVRALNSAISIISQKMKHLVRNEKILGRNLLILNKKIKSLQDSGAGAGEGLPANVSEELELIKKQLEESRSMLDGLSAQLSALKRNFVTSDQLKELKYVIDSINPLEYATVSQVKEMIDERLGKNQKKPEKK